MIQCSVPRQIAGVHKTVISHNSVLCCDCSCIFGFGMITYNYRMMELEFCKECGCMKKYVSRRKNRAALILLFAFTFLLLVGYILSNRVIMLISSLLFIPCIIFMFSANRCPHCGEFFRGLYWAKSNAGYCSKCGKLIEFDDCDNTN